jgi:predicted nucleotidyltransferase
MGKKRASNHDKKADHPEAVLTWVNGALASRLRRRGVLRAYLFGSWARGDADPWSDIDLMLVAPCKRAFVERFLDYPEALEGPAGVDLLVYTPEEFARERRVNRFVRHALRHARRVL